MQNRERVEIGSIIEGTLRPADLIPAFAEELERLDIRGEYRDLIKDAKEVKNYDSEDAQFILDDLFVALDSFSPPHTFFGAANTDGASFGFWPAIDAAGEAVHFGEILGVDDCGDIPDNYSGIVLYVNDHGNASLYEVKDGKIIETYWEVV